MKVIILGSSGFIGKHFLLALSKSEGVSLRDPNWKDSLNDSNVLINLVGKAHDHQGKATKEEFFFANCELVKDIFEAFKISPAKLLIHISSIAAIEEFESLKPLKETDHCNPRSNYGKSKRATEKWLLEQDLPQDKKIIIIRPPMVHGSGDKGSLGLLYKFISKGIPYPLASFKNRRSFISIDNFIFYITEIIKQNDNLDGGIYHISDNELISTQEVIDLIKKIENKKNPDIYIPKFIIKVIAKIGDFIPFPLNTTKLKKMTNNLSISTDKITTALKIEKLPFSALEGLEKTIKSFKKK